MDIRLALAASLLLSGCSGARPSGAMPAAASVADDLPGTWVGQVSHEGERSTLILRIERTAEALQCFWSTPALDLWDLPIGPARIEGSEVRAGPLTLLYDRGAQTLEGPIPAAIVPVHPMRIEFHRSPPVARTPRPAPTSRIAQPLWVYDAGAPLWADLAYSSGTVLAGADDGVLHALDARTGKALWTFRAGGAIRARPLELGGDLLFPADDGFLHALDAKGGKERWRARIQAPVKRVPLSDPNSRYELRASGVATDGSRLYLGTQDGRALALGRDGVPAWEFRAGDSVVSTPVVASGKVYFGSFDGSVYALSADSGALLWRHATGAPVTSSAAVHGGLVVVGSRSFDLVALDAASGKPAWTRYVWFSWIESPASIVDGAVYVGSSDAAKLFAFDAATGRRIWEVDAGGSAWGEPAVTADRVFAGAVGTLHYLLPHRASAFAVDRRTGTPVWRYPVDPPPAPGAGLIAYGFAASPAVAEGRAYFGGLDGKVYAFDAGQDGSAHAASVDRRGDHAMGFAHDRTAHHFGLTPSGGFISAESKSAEDTSSRDAIVRHFRHIASAFREGDFAMPMFIHDRVPPGVEEMKRLAGEISYGVEETPLGARVVIRTANPRALEAVHRFLRFQIEDHRTGDSLEVQR